MIVAHACALSPAPGCPKLTQGEPPASSLRAGTVEAVPALLDNADPPSNQDPEDLTDSACESNGGNYAV